MADIPHPSCFGLESSPVEPSTPSPISSIVPVLPMQDATVIHPVEFSSTPLVSTPMPNAMSSMAPHAAAPVYHSHAHPAVPPTQPSYPFYFDSHPLLSLYDLNRHALRPPSSTWFMPGYSQFEVAFSSSAPPRHA